MNRKKNVSSGIIMGLVNNVLSIILPFASRTIIIYKLGTEYVGLGSLFTSILQVLSLSELGFGTAIGYLLYKPIAENDRNKVNAILKFYRNIYRIIGSVITIISIVLLPFLKYLIAGDVPIGINIYILYAIYVLNTVVSYMFFSYKKILLSANQRYDIEVTISSVVLIIQYIIQIFLLLFFSNYYLYVLVLPLMTIIGNIICFISVNKLFPGFECRGKLETNEIREILKNTGGAFFSKIGSTVYLSADNIVISAFLGLHVLGVYNNYYYVIASLIAVFAVIHNSLRPVIGNMIVTENRNKVWLNFKRINYLYMLITIVCCSCCLVLFQDFEYIWCGKNNLLSYEIVVLLVVYLFVGRTSAILGVYQEAAGIMWQGKFIPLISAIANLSINIILVNTIGLMGVLISSIICYAFINLPGYAYIIFRYLFKKEERIKFYKDILILTLQCLVVSVVSYAIFKNFRVGTWVFLVIKGIVVLGFAVLAVFILNIRNSYILEVINSVKNKLWR